MLEKAKKVTAEGRYTYVEYARYADDLVVLVDGFSRHTWLLKAAWKRLGQEFAKLQVEINETKSRAVDLTKGESFSFLGFDFRQVKSRLGHLRPHYAPRQVRRKELNRKLKVTFRRYRSRPVDRLIHVINPILRGWVAYFRIGHSSRCFGIIRDWVEKKVRRHLMKSRGWRGFGWSQWSRRWLYVDLGLFSGYRVDRSYSPKVSQA